MNLNLIKKQFMRDYTLPFFYTLLIVLLVGFSACKSTNYDESLDDLVHGIYFGMEKEVFFKHCWDLNQEGKTGHGTVDNNVMYEDSINFEPKVVINFYPEFEEDKISELPMSFYFKGWAPWNKKKLSQDVLRKQVLNFFEKKYDTKFESKKLANGTTAYFKVIPPITIRVYDDIDEMFVKADIKHAHFQKK